MSTLNRFLGIFSSATSHTPKHTNIPAIEVTAPEATAYDNEGVATKMRKTSSMTNNRYDYAVQIVCQGGAIFDIHHGLLRSASRYMARELKNIQGETVNLSWADPDIFEYVKEWLYLGKLPIYSDMPSAPIEAPTQVPPDVCAGAQDDSEDEDFEPSNVSSVSGSDDTMSTNADLESLFGGGDGDDKISHSNILPESTPPSSEPPTYDGSDVGTRADINTSTKSGAILETYVDCDSLNLTKLYHMAEKLEMKRLAHEVLCALFSRLEYEQALPLAALHFAYKDTAGCTPARKLLVMYATRHASMRELRRSMESLPESALLDLLEEMAKLRGPIVPWLDFADDAYKFCSGLA